MGVEEGGGHDNIIGIKLSRSEIGIAEERNSKDVLEIDEEVPHGLGPIVPFALVLDLARIDAQFHNFALVFRNLKRQLELLRILDVLDFLDLLRQVPQLCQHFLHDRSESALAFPPIVADRLENLRVF